MSNWKWNAALFVFSVAMVWIVSFTLHIIPNDSWMMIPSVLTELIVWFVVWGGLAIADASTTSSNHGVCIAG